MPILLFLFWRPRRAEMKEAAAQEFPQQLQVGSLSAERVLDFDALEAGHHPRLGNQPIAKPRETVKKPADPLRSPEVAEHLLVQALGVFGRRRVSIWS